VSILDRFSPALCDFLTGGTGSAAILHELERTNLFLLPLDESRTWYRFHHLLASVARSELELEHPEQVDVLHTRAARWFHEHGLVDEAVRHSLASGDTREAARLMQASWLDYVGVGRTATVLQWLQALGPAAADEPASRVTGAWMAALTGDELVLNRHLASLEAVGELGPLPDGCHSVEAAVSLVRGLFGYGGPIEMYDAGQRALELETDGRSPFYSMAHQAAGHAAYVVGELELAATLLAAASQNEAAPPIIRVLSLACRSMTEEELGNRELSLSLAEAAMRAVYHHRLGAMLQASPAYTALGRAQLVNGDVEAASVTIEKGLALRQKNPAQGPWGNIHHLLAAARVAVASGEFVMAHHVVDEASARMGRFGLGMDCMRERLHEVQLEIRAANPDVPVREPLTEREIEVLRLLQGSLSLGEIAGELFISTNTVKTHAKAVYRKLGVGSRSEAVLIARARMLV
jgi:LuxR family maltose regulon positive regulatory protein